MQENNECDICRKRVSDDDDGLLCDKCLTWKHRTCLSIGQKSYLKLSKSKNPWYCDKCKTNNDHPNNQMNTSANMKGNNKHYTIDDVMAKLEDMDQKYNNLFIKYNEQVKINEELKLELAEIKQQLNKNEQKELNKNITIHGIPYQDKENVQEIVKQIGDQLQVPISYTNFSAFRIGGKNKERKPIKVIFQNEEIKTKMLRSKHKKQLNTESLGYKENHKIYLNHDLTKENLKIFKEAQKFKMANSYKFLWISGGKLLLRKDEQSKVILIESEKDLKN